ncbi:3-phosphoshikimate 1-carboxyvinyltransferase [Chlamydia sp. 17-3921]|uniref:3-phosphoshikimate 1-carboxyvinyltransferase n=1 Tax=Chlamydia sp. 17-3921 TaxID=2675798 RepID=UPI00191A66AC|nr:3-phosphoshikimate 1-carboxyvinyltransferase [Chlamydia sp. 17-3921]
MLTYKVSTSSICGNVSVPPSKSHSLRAILWAALAKGTSFIHNYLDSPDTITILHACKQMGATIKRSPTTLEITGTTYPRFPDHSIIDAGNSGIALRFLTALACMFSKHITFTGSPYLKRRPMAPLIEALENFGASFTYSPQTPLPFSLKGPLYSGYTDVDGSDSQFASALAFACTLADGPFSFTIIDPKEHPWFALTLWWLERLSLPYTRNNNTYSFPGNSRPKEFSYSVSGDFSSTAFIIAAALLSKGSEPTRIHNLDMFDSQGDKELLFLLQQLGASIEFHSQEVIVYPSIFSGSSIDMDLFIDAVPILAVLCCFAESPSHLYNAQNARNKESDRILVITEELQKMGACIQPTHDGLIINPGPLHGAVVNSHNDHRIAMALTIAAMRASGDSIIYDIACVKKSFPYFSHTLNSLGVRIQESYEDISMRSTYKWKNLVG